ncbi:DUF2637 domain-containing protein [Streptomyces sp. MBT56]|uniref:DUF2637 domain-containing protein n=1 Tax=unclassified Streptomyces TaxID=2593676 RepID=UPI001909853E|nr:MULTISPECIES: DUF2637 domain-containing protein [unclassified Streptomyces]MBK3555688.1 DUF2637 domain-containing protein [Streptomyces sp. MBT56]MBK3602395.1 DUF2637 domain-containing protein [Streptomyces sp. MBT54]MBK3617300.1 DUF2637 domain-containing protein [Streptomyces sp. MBT98]
MSGIEPLTPGQIKSAERALSAGTWAITAGAVLFSVFTVTPLVERVTPDGWGWTAPILPLVVDAAVVIVVRLDATVDRLRTTGGRWPAALRWLTGLMTLLLNIGDSALKGDATGVAVHAVAPMLLIVTAEAARSYRAAIGRALDEIERSRAAEQAEREQAAAAREQQARAEREQREQQRRADERDRTERAERLERERADREERQAREAREHAAAVAREQAEREAEERREVRAAEQAREDRARAERDRVARERAERERAEQSARDLATAERRAAREQREQAAVNALAPAMNKATPDVNTPPAKLDEQAAREHITAAVNASAGVTVRQLADETGWSIGWVSARRQELQTSGGAS